MKEVINVSKVAHKYERSVMKNAVTSIIIRVQIVVGEKPFI